MKTKLIFGALMATSLLANAQWISVSAPTTMSTNNNVRIGAFTPANMSLQVGDAAGTTLSSGVLGMKIKFSSGTSALFEMEDPTGVNNTIFQTFATGTNLTNAGSRPLSLQLNGGRVGIGTTNPLLKLDIETNSTNDGIRTKQTGTTAASFNLESVTGRRWALFSTGSGNSEGAGNFGLYDYSGGGYRMFVNGSTGFTGFGTITPRQMLNVNNGALLISGGVPGFGGPQLLFSDNATVTPNGRWAIEYNAIGGLNFWTPWNPSGPVGSAGNYSLFLRDDGKIGMGATNDPGDGNFCASAFNGNYRLYVNGGILTTKVKVANYCSASWADYVFAADYVLPPLADVETYIKENSHLPNIPSAMDIEKEGLDIADMQSKQMAKIEELTLYMIGMKKEIDELKKQNAALQAISSSSKN
jgi:hypothetical protein